MYDRMTLIRYIALMFVATALSWSAWYTVLSIINPFEADAVGLILFYLSFGISLTGTFALIGFVIRWFLVRDELTFQKVLISFRQGIFLSILLIGMLLLQRMRILTWYNAAFLILGLTIAEFFVISRKKKYRD